MKIRTLSSLVVLVVALMVLTIPVSAAGKGNTLRVGPGQEYATIQAAVDAAKQGSKILVYPDTYDEAVSITTDNLEIVAQGDGVIVEPPQGWLPAGFDVHADRVTIRGFEIAYGADCAAGIAFEGSHNTFADNYIYLNATCFGVNALVCRDPDGGSDYNTIEGNTIHQADLGIEIQAATEDAINRGNVIRDNTLEHVDGLGIGVEGGSGFLITGNSIAGPVDGICIAIGTGFGNAIAQGHHTVVKNTMGYCKGNGISLYAAPGGTLTHNRVANNTVQTCGADCIALEAGAEATLTHNAVVDNEASFSGICGIKLGAYDPGDAPGASVSDSLVGGNTVYRNLSGVCLTPGAVKNRVLKNVAQDQTSDGFVVAGDGNMLMGNTAHSNDWAGIQVQGKNNTIISNTPHDNGVSGIEVDGKNNTLTNNTADDNGNVGIWIEGDDNTIFNNTALGNGVYDLADAGAGNRWWNNEYVTADW